jgi:hypothetical protein
VPDPVPITTNSVDEAKSLSFEGDQYSALYQAESSRHFVFGAAPRGPKWAVLRFPASAPATP